MGEYIRVAFPAAGPDGPLAGVALATIDRPRVLNALRFAVVSELADALEQLDADPACRAIVVTGAGDRAFAAGADIGELAEQTAAGLLAADPLRHFDRIGRVRTPTIAAVRGYALGGGCELAMLCDMIVAAEDARFGLPEIGLGVIPGAGGTQRMTRAIGRAKAMELVLTGRRMDAREAEAHGLVSRVVPVDALLAEALGLAAQIAAQAPIAVLAAKEAVNRASELPLAEGVAFERRAFAILFDTDDQGEGMAAFLEKRPPVWRGR